MTRTRHKLSQAAQRLLREGILGGDDNAALRQRLRDAGFDGNLTRQALSYYRASPELREAGRLVSLETRQAQYGLRARRVALLHELAEEVQKRLDAEGENTPATLSVRDTCRLRQMQFRLMAETGRLVDAEQSGGTDAWMEQARNESYCPPPMTFCQKLTLFVDMFEVSVHKMLNDKKEDAPELAKQSTASVAAHNSDAEEDEFEEDDDAIWGD